MSDTRVTIKYNDDGDLSVLAKALSDKMPTRTELQKVSLRYLRYDLDMLNSRLQSHINEFIKGERTRGSTEWWVKKELRDYYRRAYGYGLLTGGNYDDIDDYGERELKRMRLQEYTYLKGFLDDIEAKRGTMPYRQRAGMYANALPALYWLGFVRSNLSTSRRIRWVVNHDAEHCDTCEPLHNRTWTVKQFLAWYAKYHILPSENTKCLSNCKCRLEDFMV